MGPKKEKKVEKEEPKGRSVGGAFTEVERTFLELELTDCNRKLARLRTVVTEYEQKNEELQKSYEKLDEDRADIIAYLKKILHSKNEENHELKEKVKGLENTREIETAEFKETVKELEKNFRIMKDQLTSENKLLAGKLNTLEEFRAIRDVLMKKFDKQQQDFKDQEMKYKRLIYDAEKKFVIGKDKLKKEMEARLLQLAQDFQDATELRIAASTHRVIRENIAINNELESILGTQSKLTKQNEEYQTSEKAARVALELAEEERDKAINKNVVQLKVIDQLTSAFQTMEKEKALSVKKTYDFELLHSKIDSLTKENESLNLKVRILEQNLHARITEQNKSVVESSLIVKECENLKSILKDAAVAVKAALKLDEWAKFSTGEIMDRQTLLAQLLDILTKYREMEKSESIETLASLGKVYQAGDLGFIPKVSTKKSFLYGSQSSESKESRYLSPKVQESSSIAVVSSAESLKTIPSLKLLQRGAELEKKTESIASFVTSVKSTVTLSEKVDEEATVEDMNMEQKLEASKIEIQKSILKDLQYSQLAVRSQMKYESDKNLKSKTTLHEEEEEEKKAAIEGEEEKKEIGEETEGKKEIGEETEGKKEEASEEATEETHHVEEELPEQIQAEEIESSDKPKPESE